VQVQQCQQWKFEQERVVSRIPAVPIPQSENRSSHLVLEAQFDETRPVMPGTPVVLGMACQVRRLTCEIKFYFIIIIIKFFALVYYV
jgi:hypothetical protein